MNGSISVLTFLESQNRLSDEDFEVMLKAAAKSGHTSILDQWKHRIGPMASQVSFTVEDYFSHVRTCEWSVKKEGLLITADAVNQAITIDNAESLRFLLTHAAEDWKALLDHLIYDFIPYATQNAFPAVLDVLYALHLIDDNEWSRILQHADTVKNLHTWCWAYEKDLLPEPPPLAGCINVRSLGLVMRFWDPRYMKSLLRYSDFDWLILDAQVPCPPAEKVCTTLLLGSILFLQTLSSSLGMLLRILLKGKDGE